METNEEYFERIRNDSVLMEKYRFKEVLSILEEKLKGSKEVKNYYNFKEVLMNLVMLTPEQIALGMFVEIRKNQVYHSGGRKLRIDKIEKILWDIDYDEKSKSKKEL